MIKKLLGATAALMMTTGLTNASTLEEVLAATYKMYEGSTGICSEQFVGNNEDGAVFLTAAHCVEGMEAGDRNIRVQKLMKDVTPPKTEADWKTAFDVASESVVYQKPIRTMKAKDVAVIQVLDKSKVEVKPVDIATIEEASKLKVGDRLIAVGYPSDGELTVTEGMFTAVAREVLDVDNPLYKTTVPVTGGSSGGGLYANFKKEGDKVDNWKLIGTTFAGRRDIGFMTYYSVTSSVHEVLKGVLKSASNHKGVDSTKPEQGKTDTNSLPDNLPQGGSKLDEQ